MYKFIYLFVFISILILPYVSFCQSADTLVLKEGLEINLHRPAHNKIISPNPAAALVETGNWKSPSENEELEFNDSTAGIWKKIISDNNGWFKDDSLYNGYIYFQYSSDKDDIVLLEGMGNSMVYVNGIPHSGNPYQAKDTYEAWEPRFDYSLLPIKLNKGKNEFLFECGRGVLKVKIHKNVKGLLLNPKDLTIPDLIINETADTYGAIPVINASEKAYKGLLLKTYSNGSEPAYYPVNQINPLSVYKTPFYIKLPVQQKAGNMELKIELIEKKDKDEKVLSNLTIQLRALNKNENHKETFISRMDGSVQYYAVNPPQNMIGKPALFLSLHGAGVEAINQANAYSHKNWGYIVAPTNRRPYGYNWENWGRLDALEVLNIAKQKFNIDENRIYLTGHSMGGHGTWHLGINYADQFAAIGPSAGWISIWSYRIRGVSDSNEVRNVLIRSTKQSDTYAFSRNLQEDGIYILQGADDDNVPPEQPRSMVENLSKFHKDFIYYEQPGAGHWWDNSDEPGADCVDWPPMFDFFAHHSVPGSDRVKIIKFVTSNPAVSSKKNWIEIINQREQQKLSSIEIRLEPGTKKYAGTTKNVETLLIDASVLSADTTVSVELDSQLISGINILNNKKIYLGKENGKWKLINEPGKENKYPSRCGNFREALNYQVAFVYGTKGNREENEWAYGKARYDAERIWYQGNGSVEIIKDDDFNLVKYKDRNVVLFGNSNTNSAWNLLLKDSPVQVSNGKITAGKKEYKGDDFSCLMIRPRKESEFASVAVVCGTGIEGMKLSDFAQYSHPYMSLPDLVIYNSGILKSDDDGVKFAGYFGNDWSIDKGEFISR